MWISRDWKDYEIIDTSGSEKLERWGRYILLRPDPQVIWDTPKTAPEWNKLNGHYHRSSKGGGEWEFFDLPEEWQISYKGLTFNLKPFSFKHTGLFPEQAVNWDWFGEIISKSIDNGSYNKDSIRCQSRSFRHTCRCFKGHGNMGKGKCDLFRAFGCSDTLACR